MCKKKPQTETKSLAFGSVKELLDCHLEHIESNSQTTAKLIDNRIRKSDFEQGYALLEKLSDECFTVENPKLVNFLVLAERVATGLTSIIFTTGVIRTMLICTGLVVQLQTSQ